MVRVNLFSISISFSWTGASSSCSSISVCKLRRLVEEDFVVITLLLLLKLFELLSSPLPGRGTSGTASVSSPRASTLRRLDKSTWGERHLALALALHRFPDSLAFEQVGWGP